MTQRRLRKQDSPSAHVQEFQAALVHHASDFMFVLDRHGVIEFANHSDLPPVVAQLLGRGAEPLRQESENIQGAVDRVARTGDAETLQVCTRAEDGTEHWYSVSMKRAEQLTPEPKVLLFLTDVTERQRTHQELHSTGRELAESRRQMVQAQKMESIGRLAGGVAHDLNNMLTAIISYSRFVMDDLVPEDPRRRDLSEVLKAADSASKLTSQLLAFSRKRPVEPVVLELNGAVRGIGKVVLRTLEASIEFCFVEAPRPVHVTFDAGQLDQLIMNLAINARDAMRDGGTLTLQVDVRRVEQHTDLAPGNYAVLTVADTGAGMSPEVMAQIFEPFFTTKGDQGTALGLATCYGIVKQALGHIEVESSEGQGAKFTVLLPLAETPTEMPKSPAKSPPRAASDLQGLALIVEDQPSIRRTVQRSLEKTGLNVIEAGTAEEALALVEELNARIDLLVTDVVLPGMNGIKLADALRRRQSDLRVLLCSGFMGVDQESTIAVDSRTAFLAKPFTGEDLVRKVVDLLVDAGARA